MSVRHSVLVLSLSAACFAGIVHAQRYPAKTVRIVTSQAGGNFDMVARTLAVARLNEEMVRVLGITLDY